MSKYSTFNPEFNKLDISQFENESKFIYVLVEVHKQIIELLYSVIKDRYCDSHLNSKLISKQEAVIAGNLVRMTKLNKSILQNICDNKLEVAFILFRCLTETAINLVYLLEKVGDEFDNAINDYINASLTTENDMQKAINENIEKRGGNKLPIENRMLNSIKSSLELTSDIYSSNPNWGKFKKRATTVGADILYSTTYASASHMVHGTWQDLLFNHLEEKDGKFNLRFEWKNARPQILEGVIGSNIKVILVFVEKELKSFKYFDEIKLKCKDIMRYTLLLSEMHEKFMLEIERNKTT